MIYDACPNCDGAGTNCENCGGIPGECDCHGAQRQCSRCCGSGVSGCAENNPNEEGEAAFDRACAFAPKPYSEFEHA